jgi:uncharacterized membrane-anchored protein
LQLRAGRYSAWIYWLAVAMVGVFGPMAADVLHVGLGIPYVVSTTFYAILLTAVFVTWHRSELTLSIHSILTRGASSSTGRRCWPRSRWARPPVT